MARYILGIDQGTTFTRAVIFNHDVRVVSSESVANKLYFPQPGWVEQDPDEILTSTIKAVSEVFKNSRISPEDIDAVGISNQLMTTLSWNKHTGEAVGRAISWQDDRNLSMCEELKATQEKQLIAKTGTHVFPNNFGTKIRWLLTHDKSIQRGVARGELLFGTVDSWLIWKLSGGAAYVTDLSNACLSLLVNTHTLTYDDDLLRDFGIPYEVLPELRMSSEIVAYTDPDLFFGARLPIASVIGDQFSAVFGQACFKPGQILCNIGTGSSVTLNTGKRLYPITQGVDSPILWAMEGDITRGIGSWTNTSGAAIQWFRDELELIHDPAEAEVLANRVPDTLGVYFVPAFAGLGGPYEDSYARGSFFGITQGTSKNHLVRAALEAMVYQIRDSLEAIKKNYDAKIPEIQVGGGGSKNDFLIQFLSDILGIPVKRPVIYESSVLGAAFLAGLATGYWESKEEVGSLVRLDRQFDPYMNDDEREKLYAGWQKAVSRTIGWLK